MAKLTTTFDVFKDILTSKRLKSFYWRTGMMILAVIVNQAIVLISDLSLTGPVVVIIGLILGEISKGIANALK